MWLNLAGWCLRPGVGAQLDAWRIGQVWQLYPQGLGHGQDSANWTEWWVFWRRVAAGLDEAQQMEVLEAVAGCMQKTVQRASAKGAKAPYTLVVNGIAMPQRIEEDGSFARPYSFAAGSNSVELRSPDGQASKRVQFYDDQGGQLRPKLRILLSWDTDNTDLDLHVVTPDGEHVYYGNRVLENGGALDVDVTTGYGPEIFASAAPQPGNYLVYVNYYGSGEGEDSVTRHRSA